MQDNTGANYFDGSNTSKDQQTSEATPVLTEDDEIPDMGEDFDLGDFQVVRREFFAHLHEPSFTFNNCRIHVNAACLTKFPNTEYVQILINRSSKILVLRPCKEGERDSFLWCRASKGKRKPRQVTCKLFFAKIFTLMGWDPNFRYKLLGTAIHSNDEYLLAFDLSSTEVYQKNYAEGEKPKTSKTPVFPAGWQNQFGLPFYEHRQSMQVNIFDGYAIYSIKDNTERKAEPASADPDAENKETTATVFGGSGNE